MTNKTFTFTVSPPVVYGNTVIDQMVERMTAFQQANGGRAVYSFELPEAHWRFLGENHAGTDRMTYKPDGMATAQINERIGPWGGRTAITSSGTGHRAFEGGYNTGNTQTLKGAGGSHRCEWDTVGDQMWYIAGSTGYQATKQNLVKYDARLDEFRHWTSGGVTPTADFDAAIFGPNRGIAHNFGMSTWDQAKRRFHIFMRTSPTGNNIYWPCHVDVAGEREYATREEWLAGRASWFYPGQDSESRVYTNAWAQNIFAPHIGTEGSLIVLQRDNQMLDRFDLSERRWYAYPRLPRMETPLAGPTPTNTGFRGPVRILVGEYLYVASFPVGGVNKFWRIHLPADGGAYTLETDLLAPCPVPMDQSGYSYPGTHTSFLKFPGENAFYAFVIDRADAADGSFYPNTGGLYRYDIDSNTWSGKIAPFFMQHLADLGITLTEAPHNLIACEIPRLGVFFIAFQTDDYVTHSFLLKPPTAVNVPGVVTGVSAGNVTQTGLALSWAAPANATSYEIEWSDNANFT